MHFTLICKYNILIKKLNLFKINKKIVVKNLK